MITAPSIIGDLAVETDGLVKTFGAARAVNSVNLTIPRGSLYGVLGPNGAGKTTTIRILATLLRPDGGTARVLGHDVVREAAAVRKLVSLTGQFASVDTDLTAEENLLLLAGLLGHSRRRARRRAGELLAAFDLTGAARHQAARLSGGMRRKLDLAASIIVTPALLFLDEPTTGLDPRSRSALWEIVRGIVADGTTVLLTTQYLDEADKLADRIAVIDHGRVIAAGTRGELKNSVGSAGIRIRLLDPAHRDRARDLIADHQIVVHDEPDPAVLSARIPAQQRAGTAGELAAHALGRAHRRRDRGQRLRARPAQPRRGLPRAHRQPGHRGTAGTGTISTGRNGDHPMTAISSHERPAPAGPAAASLAFAWRSLLKIKHVPEQLGDVIGIPVLFTLLFTYLFGGALAGSTHDYLQFLLPGTLALAVVFVTVYSGVTLNADLATGAFDRFRSMPVWQPAPILGALIGDIGRYLLAGGLVIGLGLAMGYRPAGGAAGVLAAISIVVLFASALSWAWITLGLVLRSPNAVMSIGFVILFPVTFMSNIFVNPATMPSWLRGISDVNPVSHLVTATRTLMAGTATTPQVLWAVAAAGVLIAVFAPLTALLYQRK